MMVYISLPTAIRVSTLSEMSDTLYCNTAATLPQIIPFDFWAITVAVGPGILSIDSCSFLLQSMNSEFKE